MLGTGVGKMREELCRVQIRGSFGHTKFGTPVRCPSAIVESMVKHTSLEFRCEAQGGDRRNRESCQPVDGI